MWCKIVILIGLAPTETFKVVYLNQSLFELCNLVERTNKLLIFTHLILLDWMIQRNISLYSYLTYLEQSHYLSLWKVLPGIQNRNCYATWICNVLLKIILMQVKFLFYLWKKNIEARLTKINQVCWPMRWSSLLQWRIIFLFGEYVLHNNKAST